MGNFELVFECYYAGDHQEGNQGLFSHIIATENIDLARRIGRAMIGQQIDQGLWVRAFLSVRRVSKPPLPLPWDNERSWCRIAIKLGYQAHEIRFIFNSNDDALPLQIVGFQEFEGQKTIQQGEDPDPWNYY